MTKEKIEMMIERQENISDKNYRTYQETGISRYLRAHETAEDWLEVLRMALSIADIKEQNTILRANLTDCAAKAIQLDHDNRWLEPSYLGEIGHLVKDLAVIGRNMGVYDPWR